jgi:hypothetical protein
LSVLAKQNSKGREEGKQRQMPPIAPSTKNAWL